MRAVLRYFDSAEDGKTVFRTLTEKDVEISQTKQGAYSIYLEITILINDHHKLNELLLELNRKCCHEVRLVKTQKEKVCDSCKQRDLCSDLRKLFHVFCEE